MFFCSSYQYLQSQCSNKHDTTSSWDSFGLCGISRFATSSSSSGFQGRVGIGTLVKTLRLKHPGVHVGISPILSPFHQKEHQIPRISASKEQEVHFCCAVRFGYPSPPPFVDLLPKLQDWRCHGKNGRPVGDTLFATMQTIKNDHLHTEQRIKHVKQQNYVYIPWWWWRLKKKQACMSFIVVCFGMFGHFVAQVESTNLFLGVANFRHTVQHYFTHFQPKLWMARRHSPPDLAFSNPMAK